MTSEVNYNSVLFLSKSKKEKFLFPETEAITCWDHELLVIQTEEVHFRFSSQGWERLYESFKWPSVTECYNFCTSYSGLYVASFIFNQCINPVMHFLHSSSHDKWCLPQDVSSFTLQNYLTNQNHHLALSTPLSCSCWVSSGTCTACSAPVLASQQGFLLPPEQMSTLFTDGRTLALCNLVRSGGNDEKIITHEAPYLSRENDNRGKKTGCDNTSKDNMVKLSTGHLGYVTFF